MKIKTRIRNHIKSNNYTIKLALGDFNFEKKQLGESANGLVYEAKIYNKIVAIKFLITDDTGKTKLERNKRFLSEYLNIITLNDTNTIVHYIDYDKYIFKDPHGKLELPLIIMSKYDCSLAGLKKCGSEKEFKLLFEFLIQAVGFIHQHGIIHRDLKPENILVKNNNFYLADFGIAAFNPELFEALIQTKKDQRLGNRLFSAPEQEVKGVKPHETMDIYAIGQILQWYVTGKTHRGTGRQKITTIFPGLHNYDEIIERCLQHDKNNRYQSINLIDDWLKRVSKKISDIQIFDKTIRESFPKIITGFTYSKKLEDIDGFLTILTKNLETFENELWWSQNYSNDDFKVLKKIDVGIWRFGEHEFNLTDMWIHFSNRHRRNFVLFRYRKGESFISGSQKSYITFIYDGKRHISGEEANNGFAEIDGLNIELDSNKVETVYRQDKSGFFFMATDDNCIKSSKNKLMRNHFFDELIIRKKKPSIEELTKFERDLDCSRD